MKSFITCMLGDQVKEDAMDGASSTQGEMRNVYKIFIGKSEGKRPFGSPRRRREDNIGLDLRE
jgi:hypothetical protein